MQAAQQALCGAGAIERAISNLNGGVCRRWDCKMKIAVSVHAGRAAVGEIGSSDPPTMLAIGEAMDVAHEIRKAATAHDMPFAVSEQVFTAAGLVPTFEEKITLPSRGGRFGCRVSLHIGSGVGAGDARRATLGSAEFAAQAAAVTRHA